MKHTDIYRLGLHEALEAKTYTVTRVPGGWIYSSFHPGDSLAVFVPFNNEFQPGRKLKEL